MQLGCAQQEKSSELQQPDTLHMSIDSLNKQIGEVGRSILSAQQQKVNEAALATLFKSYYLLDLLVKDSVDKAIELNKEIVGELEILLEANPNLKLIPIEVRTAVREVITDIEAAKKITEAAKKAFKEDHYQEARYLLEQLSSEMVIITTYLPLQTYPVGMKKVGALLLQGQKEEAIILLHSLLNTMVIKEIRLPLPVLKATIFIRQAQALLQQDSKKYKETVLNLLDHANYQLHLAEAMGYGEVEKDYAGLYKQIKEIRKKVEKDEDVLEMMKKLLKDVEEFQKGFEKEQSRK